MAVLTHRFKEFQTLKNISPKELHQSTGIKLSTIYHILSDEQNVPSKEHMAALCVALGITTGEAFVVQTD